MGACGLGEAIQTPSWVGPVKLVIRAVALNPRSGLLQALRLPAQVLFSSCLSSLESSTVVSAHHSSSKSLPMLLCFPCLPVMLPASVLFLAYKISIELPFCSGHNLAVIVIIRVRSSIS